MFFLFASSLSCFAPQLLQSYRLNALRPYLCRRSAQLLLIIPRHMWNFSSSMLESLAWASRVCK